MSEAASGGLTEYIQHHLTHNTVTVAGTGFHFDSWIVSLVLGLLFCFWFRAYARRATSGVPSKGQALVELIIEFVDGQLAGYKRIRHVEFVDSVPRNPSGKILRRELRARAETPLAPTG